MSQTVARALGLVDLLAEQPLFLGELAERVGVHKSTVLRLLQTLEADGYVRKDADGRYVVGFRIIALAQRALDQIDLRGIAHPHIAELAQEAGHTVHLAALIDRKVVYVDKVDGSGLMRLRSRIGHHVDLHTAGVGKVILAHLEPTQREQLLSTVTYEQMTPTTITDPEQLRRELADIVGHGWAEDDGEGEPFVNCVALPIRDATGAVCAGLSVTALRAITPLEELRAGLPRFKEISDRISHELGWRTTPTNTTT